MSVSSIKFPVVFLAGCLVLVAVLTSSPAAAQSRDAIYVRQDLISDLPGAADKVDPNLKNPWGIAFSATGPFWIADNHTGLSTVYTAKGTAVPEVNSLVVKVPPPYLGTPPGAATGIVFNSTDEFRLAPGTPARFIFSSEDGTISAWNSSVNATQAMLKVDNSADGWVYKGLAIGNNLFGTVLFAANFSTGFVDMFNTNFASVGSFTDVSIPLGYAPFGIRNINGKLYVTFARQDAEKHDDIAGDGSGFVDVFDTNGVLLKRLISRGVLNSPWGMAIAPAGFGDLAGTLLVGNFGDGTIHGFDPETGNLVGQMVTAAGTPIRIQGLWDLIFGNGGQGGDPNVLYFTAGIAGPDDLEDHGLFGEIHTPTK